MNKAFFAMYKIALPRQKNAQERQYTGKKKSRMALNVNNREGLQLKKLKKLCFTFSKFLSMTDNDNNNLCWLYWNFITFFLYIYIVLFSWKLQDF